MWEPFTERARRSVELAHEDAQRLGNSYVGTEHILFGITFEGNSLAAKILAAQGVNPAKVRGQIAAIGSRAGQTVEASRQEMVFTPRAKRVIELASEEAGRLDHNYVGTEHLLLGLIREREGVAGHVLTNLGVNRAKLGAQTSLLLGAEGQTQAPEGQSWAATLDSYGCDRANEIKRVVRGEVPEPSRDQRVLAHNLAGLVAGTEEPSMLQERVKCVIDGIRGVGLLQKELRHLLDETTVTIVSVALLIDVACFHIPRAVSLG